MNETNLNPFEAILKACKDTIAALREMKELDAPEQRLKDELQTAIDEYEKGRRAR